MKILDNKGIHNGGKSRLASGTAMILLAALVLSCRTVVVAQPAPDMPVESPEAGPAAGRLSGDKVAFDSNRDGFPAIYVMKADGSAQTRLTNNRAGDGTPDFSLDGSKIAFVSRRDGNPEIYVMNNDGSQQTRLTNNSADDHYPVFNWDGSKIAFVSSRDGNPEIYAMNVDGGGQTRLTENPAWDGEPVFSPDRKKIVFSSGRENGGMYIMNADGSNPTRLTDNLSGFEPVPRRPHVISKDGRKIAYHGRNKEGVIQIYVMNADGSGQKRLTNSGNNSFPSFSPDSGKIAFESTRDNGASHIYVMNTDGSEQKRLTDLQSAGGARPIFNPDGSKIAFVGGNGIHVVNLDGTNNTALTKGNPAREIVDNNPSWGAGTVAAP